MKFFKKTWPVLFSIIMLAFIFFLAWQIYAVSSVKTRMKEADEDLKRQNGMLKQQQLEAEKALTDIQYYQNMLDDMQPEYDVVVSKKAQKRALGNRLDQLHGNEDDEEDEFEYEEVDEEDEDEGDYADENF